MSRIIYGYILAVAILAVGIFPLHGQGLSQSERLAKLRELAKPTTHESGKYLQFETLVIETGTIKEDGHPMEYTYVWKNIGDKPLTIKMVTTGCNCAVPSFAPVAVAPGQTGMIKVTYHPKGHPGDFVRKFSVHTDLSGSSPAVVLELRGHVEPAALPTWNYPVAMGPLLLKRSKVTFSADKVQTERILCLNAGDKPLTITAMKELLPSTLTVVCEPSEILPGLEADLIIRYKPSSADDVKHSRTPQLFPGGNAPIVKKHIPIVLEGIDLPPSKRRIDVYFD